MTRIGIPVFLCLVTLSLFLPQRALAQIYVFGGTCSGSLLSLELQARTAYRVMKSANLQVFLRTSCKVAKPIRYLMKSIRVAATTAVPSAASFRSLT